MQVFFVFLRLRVIFPSSAVLTFSYFSSPPLRKLFLAAFSLSCLPSAHFRHRPLKTPVSRHKSSLFFLRFHFHPIPLQSPPFPTTVWLLSHCNSYAFASPQGFVHGEILADLRYFSHFSVVYSQFQGATLKTRPLRQVVVIVKRRALRGFSSANAPPAEARRLLRFFNTKYSAICKLIVSGSDWEGRLS